MAKKIRKIVLEEHFSTPLMKEYAGDVASVIDKKFLDYVGPRLMDFEKDRVEEMDKYGIDLAVLSVTTPGVQLEPDAKTATKHAMEVNDLLAKEIQKRPTRFAGFAHLALQDAKGAADELERCVKQLGFKGALINGHTNGEYLDDEKFWPVLERAEALDVPLYLHPADPPVRAGEAKGYTEMSGPGWAWGPETAAHVLRMIYGGAFDRFPKATIVLGHMGEALPYMLWRLDSRYAMLQHRVELKLKPSEYIQRNVMVTTSGSFSAAPLLCSMLALGVDRIMFSIDYPYEETSEAVHFMDNAPISDADKEKICHGNAEKLLKLQA